MSGWVQFSEEGISDMLDEISRVTDAALVVDHLDAVLDDAFDVTQERISSPTHQHVGTYQPTGELLASGSRSSEFDGQVWIGSITYPGPAAVAEQHRGGDHDPFLTLPEHGEAYREAIAEFWRDK